MKYPLYSPPTIPDKAAEIIALFAGVMFAGLIIFVCAAELWFGGTLHRWTPLIVAGLVPVLAALLSCYLLRQRRIKAERGAAAFYEGLRNGR